MITKQYVKQWLRDNEISQDKLAILAGVARWSLRRWLSVAKAGITLSTAHKLDLAMRVHKGGSK
jgi:hypothetical protein